jgi:16S rRNA (cytidine1402-2'-O)-methyltransferase
MLSSQIKMKNEKIFGTLFIVATPVGNLEDITFRAVKILKQVDIIAAEDTRHSRKLLLRYDINTRLISCHEHNEANKTITIINYLKNGLDIALISDAGTPTISDPGYKLIKETAKEGISIIPIPGCNAAIAGLSVAGLPTDSFFFLGFLPKKQQKRLQTLETVKHQTATLIFYESPKRVKNLIGSILDIFGDRKACLAREITKLHEEYIRGNLSEIFKILEDKKIIKGECSLYIQGCQKTKTMDQKELKKIIIDRLSFGNLGTSSLAKKIAMEYNISRKLIYQMILEIKN